MTIMTSEQFSRGLTKIAKHSAVFNRMVQELLISAAFFAFKEGSTTEFNRLITACGNGVHLKAITMWVELISGIGRVYKGEIVLNKKVRDMSGVVDADTFAPFEKEMRQVNWWEVTGEQKAESVFDEGAYMKRVISKLTKEGYAGLAEALQQAELAYLAQAARAASEADEVTAEEVTE